MEIEKEDIEFIEADNYRGYNKEEPMSHSQLVMSSMRKCLDARAQEMKEGRIVIKKDKFGNELPIYIPDTRLVFIECIEAMKMIMGVDVGKDVKDNIKLIEDDLKKKLDEYLKLEDNEWKTAPKFVANKWRYDKIFFIPGRLSQGFSYYNEYLFDKVEAYTKIYIELDKQAKELGYYKEEILEA